MNKNLQKRLVRVATVLEKLGKMRVADFMEPETFRGSMWAVETHNDEYFMYPVDYFDKEDVVHEVGKENIAKFKKLNGWFGRMSAPGYLDATDWIGPFRSEQDVMAELEEQYGDQDYEDDYEDEGF